MSRPNHLHVLLCLGLLASACSDPVDAGPFACDPKCAGGFLCDEMQGICVVDPNRDASMPDLSPPAGTCTPECAAPTPHCSTENRCVVCLVDEHCPVGNVCKTLGSQTTVCVPGCADDKRCPAGQSCCKGQCADTQTDIGNCGACDAACALDHARNACVAGKCALDTCDDGFGDCNMDPMDGCEVSLRTDPDHCTGCGRSCSYPNAVARCADGCYLSACAFGFDDCNGDEKDGCETTVLADPRNCGACGAACTSIANTRLGCHNSLCGIEGCTPGFGDCNDDPKDGCETAMSADTSNCGACGNKCKMGDVCRGGGCTCAMCNIPNASATCANGQCFFAQCNPGFANCNNNPGDGCEIDVLRDKNNCGACNVHCPLGQGCANGVCTESMFLGSTIITPAQGNQINDWIGTPGQSWRICYSRSQHGGTAQTFHNQCDNKGVSVVLYQMNTGKVVGGYASQAWQSASRYFGDAKSFLFSITTNFKHAQLGKSNWMYGRNTYGPTFGGGHDLHVANDLTTGYCNIGHTYSCRVGAYGNATCRDDFCGNYNSWRLTDLEVWIH